MTTLNSSYANVTEDMNFSNASNGYKIVAAVLMFTLSTIGIVANGFGVVMCIRMESIRQAFCKIYINVAISDCGILANFAFYVAPMIITQSPIGYKRISYAIDGSYHLFMWCVSVFSTTSLAINRLVAAYRPLMYKSIYTDKVIKVNIALVYLISLLYSVWFLLPNCEFRMNPTYGVFAYADSECGYILDIICSTVCCIVFVIIFVLNILSVIRMRKGTNKVEIAGQTAATKKRKRQETTFLLQSCINSGVFQFMTLCFHAFARIEVPFFTKFLMKTVLWQIAHMTNGFVFLALNEDIRSEIRNLFKRAHNDTSHPALSTSLHNQSTPIIVHRD